MVRADLRHGLVVVVVALGACRAQERAPSASVEPSVSAPVESEDAAAELPAPEAAVVPDAPPEDDGDALAPIELPAPAGAPPRSWSMQSSASYNRHFRGGADGEHLEASLTIEFAPGGAVTIVEDGAHRESRLSNRWGYRKRLRVWKTTWTGRWSDQRGRVQIVARPRDRDCVQREREADRPEQQGACDELAARVELECERTRERVRPHLSDADDKAAETALWSCVASGEGQLETRTPWRLRPGCVRVSRGVRPSVTYAACVDDPARPDESF